ncbi:MAG: hypothetical protein BVN30_11305 [Proteobacteria bacterium ST_bin16]|nr:MAG: hypothetical protein BVN30_11305 [Proteobacteria bacterium ST_bin16]
MRDEQENNVAAGYPFDTLGISIDHGTDGLCIFTNLEHFSAGIPKIDCSIPRDSIADLASLEIIAEAVVLVRRLMFLGVSRQSATSLPIPFYEAFLL